MTTTHDLIGEAVERLEDAVEEARERLESVDEDLRERVIRKAVYLVAWRELGDKVRPITWVEPPFPDGNDQEAKS